MMWLVLFAVLSGGWCHQLVIAGKYSVGPNHYLGTCLDSAWVTQMETEMGVSSKARDSSGRLINPFLQPALKYPRYTVDDPRTSSGKAFSDSCMPKDNVFYGLTRIQTVGYKVSISVGGASADVTQRMSSARTGVCTPTHFNAEVWSSGYFQAVLSNLEIPAYFCFIGYGGVNKYAADAAANGKPVLFYHYEPDLFHIRHKGEFDRVFLPRTDPERVKLSTGGYACNWVKENYITWSDWIDRPPLCIFEDHIISQVTGCGNDSSVLCDSDALRTVEYFWKLPNASHPQYSAECLDGDNLPETLTIDCEYMPTSSPSFAAMTVFAAIVAVLLVAAILLVVKNRNAPIIRRSQYEMLLLMIFGGFFTTGAAVAYAGKPTRTLCGIRPVLICMGFTTIFGALVIKSLRVYRVFMKAAMKRVKVTLLKILKILSIFYIGDIVIFVAWFAADFPEPTITTKAATEFRGTVDRISCSSSSFIFTALLIFWKAILLMLGLYLSFLIRNVSVDFQESPWIFGSVVVVLVGCLVIMPMSYLVDMRASTYYVLLACCLIICTVLIMCLMLVPKLFRLKEAASSASSGTSGAGSAKSRNSMVHTKPIASNLTDITETENGVPQDAPRKLSQYQVRPLDRTIDKKHSSSGDNGTST
ncbi:hypothetical protein GQ600_5802 [Phytophthora cactorum]|nr:hypothetical protein GQ600_5802 [Phytophthora cactorum]